VRREDVIVSRKEGPGLNMRVDLAPEALARIAEAPGVPPPKFAAYPLPARIAAWVILGFAVFGVICAVAIELGVLAPAHAGTGRYYSDGPDSVTACEDGSVIVRHQDGRVDPLRDAERGF
jgi:hypothetical protein